MCRQLENITYEKFEKQGWVYDGSLLAEPYDRHLRFDHSLSRRHKLKNSHCGQRESYE